MESIGEEELNQMVRDYYEASESTSSNLIHPHPPSLSLHQGPQSILQDILLEATDFETRVLAKIFMYIRNMGEPNNLKKWVVKRLQMDGYKASLCKLTSWVSTFGRAKGDYEYIEVMNKSTRLIVELDFRSQFELARPTQSYKELINILPAIFVGTEDRLNKIISLLCSAAKESLKEKGLHIPPWRRAKFMQSKWLSKNCRKISVSPNTIEMGVEENAENKGNATSSSTIPCYPSIFLQKDLHL